MLIQISAAGESRPNAATGGDDGGDGAAEPRQELIEVMVCRTSADHKTIMGSDDRFYYLGRAEEELELAYCAAHEAACRAHALLAGYYFDLFYRSADDTPADGPPLAS